MQHIDKSTPSPLTVDEAQEVGDERLQTNNETVITPHFRVTTLRAVWNSPKFPRFLAEFLALFTSCTPWAKKRATLFLTMTPVFLCTFCTNGNGKKYSAI